MWTLLTIIVFIGFFIVAGNSVAKVNVALFKGKITFKYVLKHIGIIILTTIVIIILIFLGTKIPEVWG